MRLPDGIGRGGSARATPRGRTDAVRLRRTARETSARL